MRLHENFVPSSNALCNGTLALPQPAPSGKAALPNGIVEPIHEKAMPVMLMTPDDVEQWLRGSSVEDALKMQKPAPDDAIVIRPEEKKAA
jgi:hypothetical protein